MSNRRSYGGSGSGYGGGGGGNYNSNRNSFGMSNNSLTGVNPWQSGNAPGRSGGNSGVAQSLLASSNILNSLSVPDSQLALAKLLTSILPVQQQVPQQPPSLLSLNNSFGGGSGVLGGRYNSSFGGGGDRFRRDDRRDFRGGNRRPDNRNKGGDNKNRSDPKSKFKPDRNRNKNEDEDVELSEDQPKGDDENKEDVEKKDEGPLPGYENIPQKLFHCHVCNKSMWNDVSYDTHIKGRNHRLKLRDLEEDYQVQTDLMRQIAATSLKLEEVRKGIKRRPYPEQYCKMCDLRFDSMSMFAHRSTEEHQSLKRFIHPTCHTCKKDFQVRIEFDEHLLTCGHLQNETKILLRKEKFEKDPLARELRDNEAEGTTLTDEAADIGEKDDVQLSEEDLKLIKEISADKTAVPDYDPESDTLIGRENIIPASGFYCKICRIFLLKDTVVDVHCRTIKHYHKYIQLLKDEAIKKQKEEDHEKRRSDGQDDKSDPKRRKVEESANGSDKYDPMETQDEESVGDVKVEEPEPAKEEKPEPPVKKATARRGGRGGRK